MHTMYDFVKEREQAMFEEGQLAGRAEGEKSAKRVVKNAAGLIPHQSCCRWAWKHIKFFACL